MPPIETYLLPGVTGKNQPSLQILFKTSEINTPLSALIIPLVLSNEIILLNFFKDKIFFLFIALSPKDL